MEINQDMRKKLETYIQTEYGKGFTFDQIQNTLLKSGYPEQLVKELIKNAMKQPNQANPLLHKSQIAIGIVLALFIIGFVIYIKLISPIDCADVTCFLAKANNCEAARYAADQETVSILLTTTNDCRVTKEITSVTATEPQEIKDLLIGKSMICNYKQNNFNTELINTLVVGLDKCSGPLKESLYEIVLATKS